MAHLGRGPMKAQTTVIAYQLQEQLTNYELLGKASICQQEELG
jgi:hypothetical protein